MADIDANRTTMQGASAGVAAVTVFIIAEMITAAIGEGNAYAPLRRFASLALGRGAFAESTSAAVTWGLLVSFSIAVLYGTVYGWLSARMPRDAHGDWFRQTVFGGFFGVVIWIVNWQIIARLFWPWMLRAPQFAELMIHTFAFGVPMALVYAFTDRAIDRDPGAWA